MNTRTILNVVFALTFVSFFVGCAPSSTSQNSVGTATGQDANIIGGVNSTADFQKANGIVGLRFYYISSDKKTQSTATCTGSLIKKNIV